MTAKVIREIKFEKGEKFTTKFINDFDMQWQNVISSLHKSGADLSVIHLTSK